MFMLQLMNNLQREKKIANIRSSLKKMSIVSKNSMQVQAREEKLRSRRQSLQLATDSFQSEKLMRKFSDEDQEEERSRINSFDEKYRVLEKIGEGGNALVCTCQYLQSSKVYAVKMVRMQEEHYLQLKKNFLNIKMLRHPSIIRYHALYFDHKKRLAYLIMEYFPFKNLLDLQLRDETELRTVFTELFAAIVYLHQRNLCHRDIKPENILYDPFTRRIKLIDFGISKKTFQRGQRNDMITIIGTPFYIAPEVLMGGGYDEKVDLWSTGITLYKLVAGVTPFESEYHGQTIENIIKGEIIFEPTIWDKYSFLIRDLCIRLLKPKTQRLSAKEALRHLWLCEGSPGKTRRSSQNNEDFKFPRHDSGNMEMLRPTMVQQQRLNLKHATSKEQGEEEKIEEGETRFLKSTRLNLIENKEFDLSDSSDDETSPETAQKDKST